MPATIILKLTDAGKAAAVNAAANGLQLAITHVALGTGKYNSATAGAAMTAMTGRKEQIAINQGIVTGAGGFRIKLLFGPWTGTPSTYNASELGFFAGDPTAGGVLFAVFSHPSNVIVQRNDLDFISTFNLQITDIPSGSITITVNPTTTESIALIAMHEAATNPHPQYVRKAGDTSTGPQLGVTAPQHEESKAFATTEFIKRVGLSFPSTGGMDFATNTTLIPGNMGRYGFINAAGVAVTLPSVAAVAIGASYQLIVASTSGLLVAAGADKLLVPGLGLVQSVLLAQGETITTSRNESGVWRVTGVGSRMPAGALSYFAGLTPPPGWLKANGVLLSRASYPALWQFAQTQGVVSDSDWANNGFFGRFSSGSNGSDFRVPDLRGTFLRALDDGRGIDSGRGWGTYQDHANRSHNHTVYDPGHAHGIYDPGHAHNVYDPGHGHQNGIYANLMRPPYNGSLTGSDYSGSGSEQAVGPGDSRPMVNSGTGIGIYGSGTNISIYSSSTGIQIQADGSEARPKNVSQILAIKF